MARSACSHCRRTMLPNLNLTFAILVLGRLSGFTQGFALQQRLAARPSSNYNSRKGIDALFAEQSPNNGLDNGELVIDAHFVPGDGRIETLTKDLLSKAQGRVAVRLRPQASSEEEEGGVGWSRAEDEGSDGVEANIVFSKNCLPAFRFERGGLAFDEYHTHGDVPFEEELAKRVEAALSLSRPEDTSTLKELWSPDAAGGDYRDEMAVATYVVQIASHVARELQGELCKAEAISKTDSSPVTVADFTVQALVLGVLSRYFPGHGFIAEESSSVLRQDPESLSHVLSVVRTVLGRQGLAEAELCAAIDLGTRGHGKNKRGRRGKGGRTWVLDPIDGTKGFLRGEQFCVALGLLDGGKAVAGVLGCPNLPCHEHPSEFSGWAQGGEARGLLYTAALGEGTFVRGISAGADDSRRVFVDHARKPCDTRVLESVEAGHTSHAVAAQVCNDLGITLPPIRVDGQCKYGLLSEGQGGIYLRLPRWGYVENIWDHCAGSVVIREAGGKVTDTRGEPLDFSLGTKLPREVVGVVASCGRVHSDVLRAVDNRQLEDWARVVARAETKSWESEPPPGSAAPSLPGVEWMPLNCDIGGSSVGEAWQATALSQRRPLVMRTSDQFYGTLARNWHKLVAVLFHGGTSYSQHAVGIFESLALLQQEPPQSQQPSDQRQQTDPQEQRRHRSGLSGAKPPSPPGAQPDLERESVAAATTTTGTIQPEAEEPRAERMPVLLAEANVMSLIEVADRQAIGRLPSLHLHLGGREILRIPVNFGETVESLGKRIDEVAVKVCQAGGAL
ncbi:unnamed protein product [Ectocarpus sp. 12 AP-2014]